ncbi:branched-chain amino acid ABC transporter permease [Microvirga brassicacearum]|uniref:Branched-chain amino acid ABC transporter permease n=1 Tax=Microvirga brassicacearum TaxID=2580413 RepID=A0A5N3P6K2_9HYPH|nr:branched-chain amino acid ABC transporter permease [Microvirga brassicacearum]KAB0265333.1 branched-chain amino acid ABC transporter permease [Microvirga brassicacearum]
MKKLAILLVVALVAAAPFVVGGYETNVLMNALLYVILATGLNLVAGYCGQFSFAQGAFYGIGAYTTAILSRDLGTGFWFNFPVGIAVAGLFGLLLGIPALRLKGHFLAIVTIAFQTIVYLTLSQWTSFTGGQTGLPVPSIGPVSLFGTTLFEITSLRSYFWFTLVIAVILLFAVWRLLQSRIGREWIAIRDDETLASAVGLDTTRGKLTAFVGSAALAGAAGVITAHAMRGVTPDDFTIWISATVVAMMIVGGKGTFIGPIIGAVLLTSMPEFLGGFAEYKMFLFGVLLVITVTLLPEGLIGRVRRLRERFS